MPAPQSFLDEIFKYRDTIGGLDAAKLKEFVDPVVNGDSVQQIFCFPSSVITAEGLTTAIVAYALTNTRLIKIELKMSGFGSSATYLKDVKSIDRNVTKQPDGKPDLYVTNVLYPEGVFGIRYAANADRYKEVSDFFAAVEAAVRKAKE
jgi:hypothetical protein